MQAELKYVSIEALIGSTDNVRKHHDPAKHAELVASIAEHGIITPLVVRPALREGEFEVAAGHRRLRAAAELALDMVPVSVRMMGDRTFREVMLTENLQRVDPDPLDEADAYQAMIDELAYDVPTLAAKFGKSETYVRARLVLTRLSDQARAALEAGSIELGHAVLLARVDAPAQDTLLREKLLIASALPPMHLRTRAVAIGEEADDFADGNSVDEYAPDDQSGAKVVAADPVKTKVAIGELRHAMAEVLLPLGCVKWDRDDATLVVTAGSCTTCPKRTGANPMLFEELNASDDRCTDASCYETKKLAWLSQRVASVTSQAPNTVLITTKRQRGLKGLDARPVLRVERDYIMAKQGARGSVPAIVVESSQFTIADQWAELGELRDVKKVTPAPTPKQTQATTTTAAGRSIADAGRVSYAEWQTAQDRFCLAISAVFTALLTAPQDPADRRDAMIAHELRSDDRDYDIVELLRDGVGVTLTAEDDAPLSARAALVVAGVLLTDLEIPGHYDLPADAIEADTGTFALPPALTEFAATAGVDAPAVWIAALTSATAGAVAGVA